MSGKHLPERVVPFHGMSAQQRKDAWNAAERSIQRLTRLRAQAVRLNLPGIRQMADRLIAAETARQQEVYGA